MSNPLKIGLLGASRVATYAVIEPARGLAEARVVAVAARNPARAAAYASEQAIGRVHDSYDALINDPDVDLVYIGTPPSLHVDQALAAIAAGKPVLVEKPFSLNARGARAVFDAGQAAGVPVFEAMHSLHHGLFQRILAILASGEIGAVRRMEAEFSVPIGEDDPIRWRPELGGGALMDLGVYPLAWCRRIAGEPSEVVRASADLMGGVDVTCEATLRFPSGELADIRTSMAPGKPVARLRVEGEAGHLEVRNPLAPQRGHLLQVHAASGERTETVDGPSSYEAQLLALHATLRRGEPFPLPADDFVRSMAAIDLVRGAAGAWI